MTASSDIFRSLDLQYSITGDGYRKKSTQKKAAESAAFFISYSLSGFVYLIYV